MTTLPIRISIVVCVYNRQDFIGRCLTSILRQEMSAFELIVINDGSSDSTGTIIASLANDPRIRLIHNAVNRGMCTSRNQGIKQARGEIVVFTDSDCIVSPEWLHELIKPFDHDDNIMIVGGKIVDPIAKTYWEKVNTGMNYIAPSSDYVAKIIGCNMAFRRQFLINNPFDEYLPAADEWDLCICCLGQNKKIFYTEKAIVTHYHRSSFKGSLEQHFRFGYSISFLKFKHKLFPFLNYGALILICIVLCLLLGILINQFYYLADVFCLFYLGLIGYWNAWGRARRWQEWFFTYPGQALMFSIFCLGNLLSPLIYRRLHTLSISSNSL